jgi:hypothetical protein
VTTVTKERKPFTFYNHAGISVPTNGAPLTHSSNLVQHHQQLMNQTQPSQQLVSTPIPINGKNAGSIQSQYKKSSTTTQLMSEAQRIDIQPSHGIDLKMKNKAIVETP